MRTRVATRDPQDDAVEREHGVARERVLAIAQRTLDHTGHAGVALDDRGKRVVRGAHTELRLEPGGGGEAHFVFTERRQHLVDVAEEDRTRPDEEHTLAPEPLAVRVEEIRHAVQRDRGLPGAGTAAHDQHPGHIGSDRFVLLGLDRGDDVAHAPGAGPIERGEQGRFAHGGEARGVGGIAIEDLVVDAGEVAPHAGTGQEVAAPHHPHRGDGRGPVERLGDRRPPVDHQRLLLFVVDGEAPDIEALVGGGELLGAVETAEDQRRIADVQRGQAAPGDIAGDIALESGLVGPAGTDLRKALGDPSGGGTHRVETGVRRVDVRLLGGKFRVFWVFRGAVRHARLQIRGTEQFTSAEGRRGHDSPDRVRVGRGS